MASGGYEAWLKKHANMGRCLLVTTPFSDNIMNIYVFQTKIIPSRSYEWCLGANSGLLKQGRIGI